MPASPPREGSTTDQSKFWRLLCQFDEERDRKNEEWAKANGYTCYEEYDRVYSKKLWQGLEDVHRKRGERAAALGKTREEYNRQDPQYETSDGSSIASCSCEGEYYGSAASKSVQLTKTIDHPIPFFCPELLKDYRSQDHPDMMDFLQRQKGVRIEDLRIEPGERSKRLSPDRLARAWAAECSPSDAFDLPIWARADPTMRHMADTRRDPVPQPSPISTSPSESFYRATSDELRQLEKLRESLATEVSQITTPPSCKRHHSCQSPPPFQSPPISGQEISLPISLQQHSPTPADPVAPLDKPSARPRRKRASERLRQRPRKKSENGISAAKVQKA